MGNLKSQPSASSVSAYLNSIVNEKRKHDSFKLLNMMEKITGEQGRMWGSQLVGFGTYHYKYSSGREGDWFMTGFAPRKQNITIYIMPGFKRYNELMSRLGKYKTGKSCLYIKHLDHVDIDILQELIVRGYEHMRFKYPDTSGPTIK